MLFGKLWQQIRRRFSPDRDLVENGNFTIAEMLAEIDRVARETGARIPTHRKFRQRLVPSVRHAMAYLSARLQEIPAPVVLDPEQWDSHPILKAIFLDARELTGLIRADQTVKGFFARTGVSEAFALLTAAWKDKTAFGTAAEGEIIRRDVLQKTVYFENFSITGPARDLDGARREALHRAMVDLFDICLAQVATLRSWQKELEAQQDLLEFKMLPPEAGDRSPTLFKGHAPDADSDETAEVLAAIGKKLVELKNELDSPEDYFNHLDGVLMHPERHLKSRLVALQTGRMGALQIADPKRTGPVIELPQFDREDQDKFTAVWVRIDRVAIDGP